MKLIMVVICLISINETLCAQWQPAGDKLKTQWAEQLDPSNVLTEYPRPIMERSDWMNLNGLWNYAICELGKPEPKKFDGQIVVPCAIESYVSGGN